MIHCKKTALAALVALSIGSGAAQAATELVVNGGFEANGGNWGTLTSWTSGPFEFAADSSVLGSVHGGSYSAGFSAQALESMSQSVGTVSGQTYTLSFWLMNTAYAKDADGTTTTNEFLLSWGGEPLWDAAAELGQEAVPAMGWTQYSLQVQALSSSTSIRFEGFNKYGYFGLDDVSLQAVTAVPEPAGYVSLLAGLGVLGVVVRRRK